MVVVKLEVIVQCGLQIGPAIEAGLRDQLTDPAIEAFHHAVSLRVARRRQAMLDFHAATCLVEGMIAAGLLVFGGEAVGKLRAVVGQYLGDLDRRCELQTAQEIDATTFSHIVVNMQKNPARRAVNGNKQVAA